MISPNYELIGRQVKKYREAMKMTQQELAEAVGVSNTHICHIELSQTKVSLAVLMAISQTLHVNINHLLYGDPDPKTAARMEADIIYDAYSADQASLANEVLRSMNSFLGISDQH